MTLFSDKCCINMKSFTEYDILLLLGKETVDNVNNLKVLEVDRKMMETEGLVIGKICLKIKTLAYCLDRKAANLYLGLMGGFCDLCNKSKEECRDPSRVEQGFEINRSIEETMDILDLLFNKEEGAITKRAGDYEARTGVSHQPTAEVNAPSIQVLHALLRAFDHFTDTCVRLNAGVKVWGKGSARQDQFVAAEKKKIQADIAKSTGIRWDYVDSNTQGGTTTTGNTVRRLLLEEENYKFFTRNISSEDERAAAEAYGHSLALILRAMSSGHAVNLERYRAECKKLYLMILKDLWWVSITPTLHKLLAHTGDIIEANDGYGLKKLSEEGPEAINKRVRQIRTNLARKRNQQSNLTDVLNRLWIGSDPMILSVRANARTRCYNCRETGHNKSNCPLGDQKANTEDEIKEFFL